MAHLVCFKCGTSLDQVPRPITRRSHCPECFAELYSCLMCRRYTTRFHSKCEDERADPPERKDNANFCEYFKPRSGAFDAHGKMDADAASNELNALFGKGDAEAGESDDVGSDESRSAAEDLFQKD
jgi:hypothetical protein